MRRLRQGLAIVGLVLCGLLAGGWWAALPRTPDGFYDASGLALSPAGRVLRAEPLAAGLPEGAEGWRILYATTRPDGSPAAASAVVVRPAGAVGPLPLVAYAHGTTGVRAGCAPSLFEDPFPNVPGFPQLLDRNWAYVATDYAGLGTGEGHYYLVGQDAGRAVLDSIAAAQAMDGLSLSGATVVWGHSQGGHSALWAGQIAADYAPTLDLRGVAAVAPASDLPALVEAAAGTAFGKIVSAYLVAGYEAAYPALDPWGNVGPPARWLARDIARRCIEMPDALVSLAQAGLIGPEGIFAEPPAEGAFGARLAENVPTGPFAMPVLLGQGAADPLVLPPIQEGYARALCDRGQPVAYSAYPGEDHVSVVQPGSAFIPDLIAWTEARFRGEPAPETCAPG